jgi:hypothetical protein
VNKLRFIGSSVVSKRKMENMAEEYPWYKIVTGEKLEQGDIFYNYPIFLPKVTHGKMPKKGPKEKRIFDKVTHLPSIC